VGIYLYSPLFLQIFTGIQKYREVSVYVSSLSTTMKSLRHYAYHLLEFN